MKKFLILSLILIVVPIVAYAALVPCGIRSLGQPDCTICDLIALAQTLINWFIKIVLVYVAMFMILWAGFLIITDIGSGKNKAAGFNLIKRTLIGILVILLSWTIINTMVWLLAPKLTGPSGELLQKSWFKIDCHPPTTATTINP